MEQRNSKLKKTSVGVEMIAYIPEIRYSFVMFSDMEQLILFLLCNLSCWER